MENDKLYKLLLEQSPELTLKQISFFEDVKEDDLRDYQWRMVQSCQFSKRARDRDYNQAIADKLEREKI